MVINNTENEDFNNKDVKENSIDKDKILKLDNIKQIGTEGHEVVRKGALGEGIPLSLWTFVFILANIYLLSYYGNDPYLHLFSFLLLWLAPFRKIGFIMDKIGHLRENLLKILKYIPDLLPYSFQVAPYLPTLIDNMDKMGPFLDNLMQEKEHVLPHLPEILSEIDKILPYIDILGPKLHILAPHIMKLLPHLDILTPHIYELEPYLEDMMVFLDIRGWEEALPYLNVLVPYIHHIAPHSNRLAPHIDALLPHLPIIVKYVHNLAPNMDNTIEVLDRLLPLSGLLPLADFSCILYSSLVCKSLPHVAKILPKSSSDDLKNKIASPLPSPFNRNEGKMTIELPKAITLENNVVYYLVVLNDDKKKLLRFSELREIHKSIKSEVSNYLKMKLLSFPKGTTFGRALNKNGIEQRRKELEIYYERYSEYSDIFIEESSSFRSFVRLFANATPKNRSMSIDSAFLANDF